MSDVPACTVTLNVRVWPAPPLGKPASSATNMRRVCPGKNSASSSRMRPQPWQLFGTLPAPVICLVELSSVPLTSAADGVKRLASTGAPVG